MGNLTEDASIKTPTYQAVAKVHGKFIFTRRMQRLAKGIQSLLAPGDRSALDVGSGSGEVAFQLQQLAPQLAVHGLDVLVREQTAIPTTAFDGLTIPYPDNAFDVVFLVDVLHHSKDPTKLLFECARVAKHSVIVKDHLQKNRLDRWVLRLMDWTGNASHGVHLEYTYFNSEQWGRCFREAGVSPTRSLVKIGLYPFPLSVLFERHLHFITALSKAQSGDKIERIDRRD